MMAEHYVSALERKHEHLEEAIKNEISHPSSDYVRVTDMKRRKLAIKDEIEKLQAPAA